MNQLITEPINEYIFRKEEFERLRFGVTSKLTMENLWGPNGELDIKFEKPYFMILNYIIVDYIDGHSVYRFEGAEK
jgi:hypothetical protein